MPVERPGVPHRRLTLETLNARLLVVEARLRQFDIGAEPDVDLEDALQKLGEAIAEREAGKT